MNIFVTNECPVQSAVEHNDTHCRKMLMESCALLSTDSWSARMKLHINTRSTQEVTNPEEILKDILSHYMPFEFYNGWKIEGEVLYTDVSDRLDNYAKWEKKRDLTRKEVLMWELLQEIKNETQRGH